MRRPPFVWTTSVARSRSVALLLRQVVHLSAVRRAVRRAVRHQRLPAAPRRAAGAGGLVQLPVPARADAGRRSPPMLAGGLPDGVGRARATSSGSRRSSSTSRSALLAYFCWLYKEVATPRAVAAGHALAVRRASDVAGRVLLGIATFSKLTNALLFPPIVALAAVASRVAPGDRQHASRSRVVAGGLFAINMAISGEWNYQGGEDRSTFYTSFRSRRRTSGFDVGVDEGDATRR